jgi:hypothetical protein
MAATVSVAGAGDGAGPSGTPSDRSARRPATSGDGPAGVSRCLKRETPGAVPTDETTHTHVGDVRGRRSGRRRPVLVAIGVIVAGFVLIQLIPYGHDHGAPATTKRARLSAAGARIARGACMDCHSNATTWPWYSNVAPVSLLVVHDVKDGRERMNLSRWDQRQPELDEVVREIDGGGMPPRQYTVVHGAGRLSASQKRTLIAAFRALYRADPPPVGRD